MKRILLILCLIVNAIQLSAQDTTPDYNYVRLELEEFTNIDIDAPVKLTLLKLEEGQTPYLEYNTHGYYASKFTATVDKAKRELNISERIDTKRESITDVKLYYSSLQRICIAHADVSAKETISGQLLDVFVANESHFVADIDVLDLLVNVSGKCRVVITGNTLYHTAEITTAQYDASKLESVSTVANVSHNGMAKVDAHERLQATTSTGGTIYYVTEPAILRSESSLFGGMISKM